MAGSIVCSSCRYFHVGFGDRMGVCRRFPTFQNRSQNEWCGEFASKMVQVPVIDPPQVEEKRRGRPRKDANA